MQKRGIPTDDLIDFNNNNNEANNNFRMTSNLSRNSNVNVPPTLPKTLPYGDGYANTDELKSPGARGPSPPPNYNSNVLNEFGELNHNFNPNTIPKNNNVRISSYLS